MRIYIIFRWFALLLAFVHFVGRIATPDVSVGLDLILYNLVVLIAMLSLFQAPLHNDGLAVTTMALAIMCWGIGSLISSYSQLFGAPSNLSLLANIFYTLFYPFALIAIPRATGRKMKLSALEFLDSAIFGLGLTAIVTALLLGEVLPKYPGSSAEAFFSLLYPVCDVILIISILISLITQEKNLRLLLLTSGVLLFAATDFLFLWMNLNGLYEFGQLSDDGWIMGLALMSLSFWSSPGISTKEIAIHPAFIAVSVFMSPTLLAVIALRPGYFPSFIIFPTIATLFLAFIRMAVVLRHSRNLGEERVLARTDELTGLPNRRRLIAELNTFGETEGALLLLDLNGFKPINDQYGHLAGDKVLRQVATRFSRSLPTGAVLARLGGDEFGVLINGSYESTMEIAHALNATLSYPITIDGLSLNLSVAIGHVQNDGKGDLLHRADEAMYIAKRQGEAIFQSL